MKPLIDFSKLKKVKDEKDHAILRHKDGHEIRIAKGPLSPDLRKQLAAIPMHKEEGQSNPKLEESKKTPKMAEGGQVSEQMGSTANLKENYKDRKPKMLAEGGEVDEPSRFEKDQASLPKTAAEAAALEDVSAIDDASAPTPQAPPAIDPTLAAQEEAPQAAAPVSAPPAAGVPAPSAVPAAAPALQAAPQASGSPTDSNPYAAQQGMLQEGFNAGEQSIGQQQTADTAGLQAKQTAAQQQQKAIGDIQTDFQKKAADTTKDIDGVIKAYQEGHIDPNHYFESKSAGSKVATAIGLIIGGLGGSDAPIKFLNEQIDRDIRSQQANLDKNNNILSAYYHQFGNARDAADMAKAAQVGIYGAKLDAAAAAAPDEAAKARALQAKSQLYSQFAPQFLQMNMRRTLAESDAGGRDPAATLPLLRQLAPEMAKEREGRLISGSAPPTPGNPSGNEIANRPLSDAVRGEITAKSQLINATQNLRNFVAQNGGIAKLNPAKRAEAETLVNELQGMYRKGTGASTSEGEQKLINEVTGVSPLSFLNGISSNPKLKALEESIGSSLNVIRKQNGLPAHPTSALAAQNAGPQAPQTKVVNGVTYQRGPNGEAIRVK